MHLTVELLHTHTHTFGPILIKEMTRGWRREGGGCGHADVATVTAVSKGWELEGSRLEKRSEEDDIRRIQMRPCSLPVDPVSYPITTAAREGRECKNVGM